MPEDRTAVVTGGGSGIGAAVVGRLLRRGLRVFAVDRSPSDVPSLKDEERSRFEAIEVDVRNADALGRVAEHVAAQGARADVLITSAGLFAQAPADAPAGARDIVDVNLHGVIQTTAAFVPLLRRTGGGRIVHVASIAGATGAALAGVYAASKAGVVALTRSHARELASSRIAVNAVLPGYVDTPMLAPMRATLERFMLPRVPLGRFAEPDEVAEVIELVATCSTPFLTGAAIPVDGGLHVG